MSLLSNRIQSIKPSPTMALSAQAAELKRQGKDVISLTAGEPDFDTPQNIKDAAKKAIDAGQTKYTPVDGTAAMKESIITKLQRDNNLNYDLSEVMTNSGAKHSLFNAYAVLLNPGDEVLIPVPAWVSYPDIALLFEAKPVLVQTKPENRFKITAEELDAALTDKTKLMILNTPSNPTGMSYSAAELKAIGDVLAKYPRVIVLSDDIYEHILYTPEPFINLVNVCPELKDRVLVINGVSKAYAMTGWRIAFTAGNADIIKAMRKMQSQSTSNPCSVSQAAAVEAFSGPQDAVKEMVEAYKARRDYFIPELNNIGLDCMTSDGAFYAFADISKVAAKIGVTTSAEVSAYMLEKAEVATIPGSAFGGEGYVRFSYATNMDNLERATERLFKLFN